MMNPLRRFRCWMLLALCLASVSAKGALQFDVFVGYDGTIHQAAWFPITCEVHNDGPSFNAVIKVTGGGGQERQVPVELPTNTRKRIVIPMFASSGYNQAQWSAFLIDSSGKVRQKQENIPSKLVVWNSFLLGAMPRTFGGLPVLPDVQKNRSERRPEVGRIQPEHFPDNPIALEGLNALYLNSEKLIDFTAPQVTALLGWVRGGGHLIIGVEQNGDINSTPWLKQFVPMELTGSVNAKINRDIVGWIRNTTGEDEDSVRRARRAPYAQADNIYANLAPDGSYKEEETPVSTGQLKDGGVLIHGGATTLAVQATRGRGKLTVLTFNPEREPFRSWKQRGLFWAKLGGIPGEFFTDANYTAASWGWSVDGVFGALIDSRQIKKLPVTWLLLLLVVYLVVIGPFDQWWLKKIGKQMLTWITFPAYVVLFSLLIYFIGYKLRAGETEWNELNIVDILPRQDKVDLRGRTYVSIYSSGNSWYSVAGPQGYASFRSELDLFSGAHEDNKMRLIQNGNSFKADVYVPVWTSLLYANDWFKTNDTPLVASVTPSGGGWQVEIQNLLPKPLQETRIVISQNIFDVGTVPAGEKKSIHLTESQGIPLRKFVQENGSYFQHAVEQRRNAMGDTQGGRLENRALTATVASFISYLEDIQANNRNFVTPPGLDLSAQAQRGDAIVLGFVPDYTVTAEMNQFRPPRMKRDTFLRLTVPLKKPAI